MESNHSTTQSQSKSDQAIAICLATFSMFVVGYTATRVVLTQFASNNSGEQVNVIPHQAALWSDLGK